MHLFIVMTGIGPTDRIDTRKKLCLLMRNNIPLNSRVIAYQILALPQTNCWYWLTLTLQGSASGSGDEFKGGT